ncbi:hypothetical protein [Rhizobium sp. Root708]|uniref:hypothetical protein n=1 Tax=Rhizobium sp. Root708 TaxID=1736592 RepID=UPI000A50245D
MFLQIKTAGCIYDVFELLDVSDTLLIEFDSYRGNPARFLGFLFDPELTANGI